MFVAPIEGSSGYARSIPSARRSRSWSPDEVGPYRLPRSVQDALAGALKPFRNRDAAYALAVFLARFWSTPHRLALAFPIDRRALAGHELLGLTENQVRGAVLTLEKVGFLGRDPARPGSRYQRTAEGLQRRPILFRFGSEAVHAFHQANQRALAAARAKASEARPAAARTVGWPDTPAFPRAQLTQKQSEAKSMVLMGEISAHEPIEPNSVLEMALARWRLAIET